MWEWRAERTLCYGCLMTATATTTILNPVSDIWSFEGHTHYYTVLTPEDAQRILLHHNNLNRKAHNRAKADQFVRDMREGVWRKTGDPLRFDRNLILADGQNRCQAVVQSGVPVQFLVIEGLDPEARRAIDNNSPRSPKDQLEMDGYAEGYAKTSIARQVLFFREKGYLKHVGGANSYTPSREEVLRFVEDNEEALNNTISKVSKPFRKNPLKPLSPGMVAAMHFLVSGESPEQADEFFGEQLARGLHIQASSPALALQNLCHAREKSGLEDISHQYAYTAKAWHLFLDEAKITQLKPPAGGWEMTKIIEQGLRTS